MAKTYKRLLFILLSFLLWQPLAHSQSASNWYYNIDENNIAISGYDVVAYHTNEQALKGVPEYSATHLGVTYWFSSLENKELFQKSSEEYLPAYGGWCTFFMGIDKKLGFPATRFRPDPENFRIINERVYLFAKNEQQDYKQYFESSDSDAILERADQFWESRLKYAAMAKGLPVGLNAMARMENMDWLPFMGRWEAEASWWTDSTGVSKSAFKGDWTIKHGYDGYAVVDDFIVVPGMPYAGTTNGPAVRGYDPLNEAWHMTYIPVNQPRSATWLMTAKFVGPGHLVGTMETKGPYGNDILQQIVFEAETDDYFEWRAHWSWDGGKSWKKNAGLVRARRMR